MKKLSIILITSPAVLLTACASMPSYDNLTSVQVQQTLDKFKAEQGRMVTPIRGKFKRAAAWRTYGVGSLGFSCSGTDTIKYVEHMNIHTYDDGTVTAKGILSACGTVDGPKTYSGLQTKDYLYLYPSDLDRITEYEIDEVSGKLIRKGRYQSQNGTLVYNEIWQNNREWSEGLGNNYTYKATGFAPENLWAEVDSFERSIVVKEGGSSAGGFQWGKALALGVGAVAGGGLSLGSEDQASVIAGIMLDSQANTSGVSNLDNAVQSSLETNAQLAAASALSEQDLTQNSASSEADPQNLTFVEPDPTAQQSVSSTSQTSNSVPTSNAPENSRKCGLFSFTDAEEQAEKDRLGAILQSKLAATPSYDYKTRNQAWRDFESDMAAWRKAKHQACGIDYDRSSSVTIE